MNQDPILNDITITVNWIESETAKLAKRHSQGKALNVNELLSAKQLYNKLCFEQKRLLKILVD